jgi:cyclophilin family peptidyl-prolyl cis-trans isomerase
MADMPTPRFRAALILIATALAAAVPAAQRGAPPVPADDALAATVRGELAAARRLPAALEARVAPTIDALWEGFDPAQAIAQVRFMDQYWRLAGNEGFDAAIDRVKARLIAEGFTELPARPTAPITVPSLWIEPAPEPSLGWDQAVATLAIVRDGQPEQVVISRARERLALEINSFSTPSGGVTAKLVDVGRGATAADYEGKDVAGAVVMGTASAGQLFTQAVVNRGAIGVVSLAPLPGYLDKNPDILQWGSIPYDEARKGFGFRATARAAEALKAAAASGSARVRAEVVTSFARKPERTLAAEIPGATRPDERIVIAAHVQEPGANDNASGTATNMELARALVTGIRSKAISAPARTLTFLWVNEISGSRRWLSEHPDQKDGVKYMFSMDMTGEDITKTGGHFLVERWPDPGAVWTRPWDPHTEWGAGNVRADSLNGDLINDLHLALCERVAAKSVTATGQPWDVRSNPYEGGSDHTQFGNAGIPSVLDWHFTDRFYHTNQDTAEKTSPEEMRRVGTAVASTAWLMASATAADAQAVAALVRSAGAARVAVETREGAIARAGVKPEDNATIVAAWRKWYDEAVASVSRLAVTPRAGADWQARRVAASQLRVAGPELTAALADPEFHVRTEAVKVAGRLAAQSGECAPLAAAVRDAHPIVRIQAFDSTPARCGAAIGAEAARVAALAAAPDAGTPWQVSAHALTALARVAPERAAAVLALPAVTGHEAWLVRAAAATAAGAAKQEPLVLTLAADRVANVRTAALVALDQMGSAALTAAAVRALNDSDEHQLLREAARRLKGKTLTPETTLALSGALARLTAAGKDTSRDPRVAILQCLAAAPASTTLAARLQPYLSDFDPEVATAAAAAIRALDPSMPADAHPQPRAPKRATAAEIAALPRRATIHLADGAPIELELLTADAPQSVARFVELARRGYYDGLTFHRLVPNFVIQGGSPDANEYSGDARYMVDEIGVPHVRGAVGVSTRGRDTGDGQIFIDLVDLPRLNPDYTVFARVASGMDAVDRMLEGAVIRTIAVAATQR